MKKTVSGANKKRASVAAVVPDASHEALLRKAKLKCTPARLGVIAALAERKVPLSAQDVYERLAKREEIDLVTVYRTLAALEKAGIAKRVDLRQDAIAYELAGERHHHHIVCVECGAIEDFELCDMEAVTKKVVAKAKHFTAVREHTLELFGVCDACVK